VSSHGPGKRRLTTERIRRVLHPLDRKERAVGFGALPRRTFLFGLIGVSVFLTAGCATIAPRNVLPQASASQIELDGFHDIRFWGDAPEHDIQAIMSADESKAEARFMLPVVRRQQAASFLAISGGADDGAFGAGLLVGWSDAGTRPAFDLVTGVSSGALIAPFVFLGREHDSQLREPFRMTYRRGLVANTAVC
jgi:patatin-like phospholipase